ncbi:MAG TPA: ribosome assembly factor SBDS [Candidatus Paceibacterota bacterium]|nr:ribosome assembly factor SBDS [Candidatus Paceibacterota bacterium]
MTNVISKLRIEGKNFEILVDLDKAIEFKKTGKGNIFEILETDVVFLDSKKGMRASGKDLMECFKTEDINEIAAKIIKNGDTQIPLEYKEKERDARFKQVVDFFVRNAVDPRTGRPYTPERIEKSLDEAGINLTNKPIDSQINEITSKLKVVIPLKIETKKIRLTIPVTYTGQVYGMLQGYKESEEWLSNGDLKVIVNIPVGFQMEFYDKLNAVTHGSLVSEELKS